MKIQVLGTGCPKCKKLTQNAEEAVKQAGIAAEVEKVTDINEIANFGVAFTPGLAIDGEVKAAGKVPNVDQIAEWISSAQSQ